MVILPETAHFTIPQEDLVLAVIKTLPSNPNYVVDAHETNPRVSFDGDQYQELTANL